MTGYKLIKPDNPSDSKKGGAGIHYKEFLPVRSVEVKNLNECVIFEAPIKNKRDIYAVSFDRSPSQHKVNLTFFDKRSSN